MSEISSGLVAHIAAFKAALNGSRGDLDAWLECNNEAEVRQAITGLLSDAEDSPTPPVSEDRKDAERYNKLVAYLVSDCTDFDDAIIAARTRDEMNTVIDTMQEEV